MKIATAKTIDINSDLGESFGAWRMGDGQDGESRCT